MPHQRCPSEGPRGDSLFRPEAQADTAFLETRSDLHRPGHQLFRASEDLPDRFPEAEPVLLEIIGETPEETRKVLHYWKQSVDRQSTTDDSQVHIERRRLDYHESQPGMLEGTFALTPLACEAFLDGAETPQQGGEKPGITVHVDMPALEGEPGGLHESENGRVLTVETVRQLACDASITRVVFGPDSEVLDVGRKTRVVPAALRRSLHIPRL